MPGEDRVALITGAAGALGRATARAFASDGWRLGLIGRDSTRLASVAADAEIGDERWVSATADLRQPDQVAPAVDLVQRRWGRIDALLHLIGGFIPGSPVAELDPSDLGFMLDQHLWSTMHVVRAVVPGMVERGWGRIVAVTSSTTISAPAKASAYATSKIAQETLLRVLAKEVAATGVTVNVVAVRQIDVDHLREREPSPKNAAWATPEEIVGTFRFLCSDEAAAVNGARIPLDGR